jgi:transposase
VAKSREVGCFLGLRPGRGNSGESEPQKKIGKEGDRYLRTMKCFGMKLDWGASVIPEHFR